MLSFIMLSVIMLNLIMLCVIKLCVIILSVVMLSDVKLNVMAPLKLMDPNAIKLFDSYFTIWHIFTPLYLIGVAFRCYPIG